MAMISIVLPAYNEALNIVEAIKQISAHMEQLPVTYELLFVNDGSIDQSARILREAVHAYPHIVAITFSRNFGKEAAIFCGLKEAKGDAVIVMDCDLQHPVAMITAFYEKWCEGYEVVEGKKLGRQQESFFHRLFAKGFYTVLQRISHISLHNASDFKLLDRKVVDALNALPEKHTFFRALSGWVGFRTTVVEFAVQDRFAGVSKWSFRQLWRFALDNVTSFTALPMQIVTFCGVLFFLFSVILGIDTLYNFFTNQAADGFTTVILVLLIMGSIIMFSLGVIGYYLAKIYEEIQARPRYFISSIQRSTKEEQQ